MTEPNAYLLGTHDDESRRLQFQAKAWLRPTLEVCEAAGIRMGETVVDLGCGPGFFTEELARMVGPEGRVVALDKSEGFLEQCKARMDMLGFKNVAYHATDVEQDALPVQNVDVIFSRWVYAYVADPHAVAGREIEALRPGGRAIAVETFNYQGVVMGPWSDDFEKVTRAMMKFYAKNSLAISAGNLIPANLCAHGAEVTFLKNISTLAQPGETFWEWYRQFSFSMLPRLVDAGLLDETCAKTYRKLWEDRAQMPGAFVNVPSHIGVVARKH